MGIDDITLDENTSRFKGNEWATLIKNYSITLAGIGGIGSWTSFICSRLQPYRLTLIDPDNFDLSNLGGQLCSSKDKGLYKTYVLARFIKNYSNYFSISDLPNKLTEGLFEEYLSDILIGGFDNMEARKTLFKLFINNSKCKLLIDGRLNTEEFQIFCLTKEDPELIKKYQEEWLFDQSEGESVVCSNKQTTFTAAMIGSMITNLVINFVVNANNPIFPRNLPFMTSFNAVTFKLNTYDS